MTTVIDGKQVAASVIDAVKTSSQTLKEADAASRPVLPWSSSATIRQATPMSRRRAGWPRSADSTRSSTPLPEETTQEELAALVAALNADDSLHGILVQLPLAEAI